MSPTELGAKLGMAVATAQSPSTENAIIDLAFSVSGTDTKRPISHSLMESSTVFCKSGLPTQTQCEQLCPLKRILGQNRNGGMEFGSDGIKCTGLSASKVDMGSACATHHITNLSLCSILKEKSALPCMPDSMDQNRPLMTDTLSHLVPTRLVNAHNHNVLNERKARELLVQVMKTHSGLCEYSAHHLPHTPYTHVHLDMVACLSLAIRCR